MKRNIIIVAGIIVLVIVLSGSYKKLGALDTIFTKQTDIGVDAAKAKATDFVKNNMVAPGTEVSVKEISKEEGLYKIVFAIGGQNKNAYITQDGATFFPQAMDIATVEQQSAGQKKQDEAAAKDVPKSDKPVVDLYVMSFCPFGNKAEDTIAPVYALLKNQVDFNFRYIVNSSGDQVQSLHGQKEVDQNERETCVLKNYSKDAWMSFATYVNKNCGSDGSCWEAGAKANNIDTNKISTCVKASGVSLMKTEEKASTDAGASGSPTMFINGVTSKAVYQYGNPESYKQAICAAFNSAPEDCSTVLEAQAATSSQGGSCGN